MFRSASGHHSRWCPAKPLDQVRYTRIRLDPPIELIRARFLRHEFVPHAHPEFAIGVIERGAPRLTHSRGVENHRPGTVVAIPPGLVHAGRSRRPGRWGYRMFYFPPVYLERAIALAFPGETGPPRFVHTGLDDPDLAGRLGRMHRVLETCPGQAEALVPELEAILADLVGRHAIARAAAAEAPNPPARIRAVRARIDAEYLAPLTIDQLAGFVAMSPSSLSRAFHRAYGLPPYSYLEYRRVAHARAVIAAGMPIARAAALCRFSDQSHLTRRFRRTFGFTPGAYAASS